MEFLPAEPSDIPRLFELYEQAIKFQKTVFDKHWLGFERTLVDREIAEKRLWKIVEDDQIACVYTVAYRDPIIWGPGSGNSAMYIHRIVTNGDFRGRGYARDITNWATEHARSNSLRYVRMDTWGDNQKLLRYYQDCGFKFLGLVTPEYSDEMPAHYRGIDLALLEIDLLCHE